MYRLVMERILVSDSKDSKHLGIFGNDPRITSPKISDSFHHCPPPPRSTLTHYFFSSPLFLLLAVVLAAWSGTSLKWTTFFPLHQGCQTHFSSGATWRQIFLKRAGSVKKVSFLKKNTIKKRHLLTITKTKNLLAGRIESVRGPHAARGPYVWHPCSTQSLCRAGVSNSFQLAGRME